MARKTGVDEMLDSEKNDQKNCWAHIAREISGWGS